MQGKGLILGAERKGRYLTYDSPTVVDLGSIADHTFSRCNPLAPSDIPPKDSIDVPHHIDNHEECSALS